MKRIKKYLSFTPFEAGLWFVSALITVISYIASPEEGLLSFIASFIGVTAIIFVAKGRVLGQVLSCIFALLYSYISLKYRYYGELITYMGMSFPMALLSVISWIKNPYKETREVEIASVSKKTLLWLSVLTGAVTALFYFVLKALGTENLVVSTVSVATSFAASALAFLRSPYYALIYSLNDLVLIALWTLAAISEPSYRLMVICFATFLANDMYAFFNWKRMRKRQRES
ncbi:MAG: nicotinamide mononucleotide transporter [Clostridia bacterium]|nr:nicotinamide mononucleotide transporter [Clostridia bacterium]